MKNREKGLREIFINRTVLQAIQANDTASQILLVVKKTIVL